MTIKIKRRSQTRWLAMVLVFAPFLFGLLNDFMNFPRMIRYTLDVAWVVLLIMMVLNYRKLNAKSVNNLFFLVVCFALYTAIMYIGHYQNILYYLWGFRNNFRFFVAFFACTLFLLPDDIEDGGNLIEKLFWINAIVSLIQYFGFGLKQDYLGGIFGIEQGANGYTNIFFCMVVARSALLYLEGRENVWSCAAKWVTALLIAALAELKFFYVECVAILILATMLTKFTWKKLLLILLGFLGVTAAATLLSNLFPYLTDFFSIEWFYEQATADSGYTNSGDINRLNAIAVINETWFSTIFDRLFGFGLGNCDTASFAIVNTPFYENYGYMHYTWISYAYMYLECGWIGLLFYFGFFALVYFKATKIQKSVSGEVVTHCRLARIMAILCVVISIYNSSLRTEAGYMAYFVLSIPFVYDRELDLRIRKHAE